VTVATDALMGMVPHRSAPKQSSVHFLRAGAARFTEPFFDHTLEKLVSAGGRSTKLSFGELREVVGPDLPGPRAVVLHTGRCGSTLLTRMLAHDRGTMAVSEPGAISVLIKDAQRDPNRRGDDEAAFKDLIVVLDRFAGRRKQRQVVKFPSWVATDAARVGRLLPETPLVFVHRPAADVVASELHGRPSWIKSVAAEVASGESRTTRVRELGSDASDAEIFAAMWASIVEACLALPTERTLFLGYEQLAKQPGESLRLLTNHIGLADSWNPASAESESRYYSKSRNPVEEFEPTTRHARPALPPETVERVHEIVGDLPDRLAERR
jgi:hypothetical protein